MGNLTNENSTERQLPPPLPRIPPDSFVEWGRPDTLLLILLCAVAGFVILPNLGDRCLWQDEAESGLLGRTILRTGLPTAWDGRQLVTAVYGAELTDSMLWRWHSWGAFYLSALGMAFAGPTPFGARLPSALLGCLSVGLTYVVARRMVRDRWTACIAAVLLLTSVQYLLMMRQARYHGMVAVTALIAVWGYLDLPSRRGLAALSLGMALLFHGNYVACACIGLGLGIHAIIWRRYWDIWLRLAIAGAVTAALATPWVLAVDLLSRRGTLDAVGYHRDPLGKGLLKQVFVMNQFVCPLVVAFALAMWARRGQLRVRGAYGLVACMAVPVMTVVPVLLWAGPRYIIHMFPLGAIVVAAAIREVYVRNDALGNFIAIVVGATNLLPSLLSGIMPESVGAKALDNDFATGPAAIRQAMLKSEWAGYVQELRQPFVGPNEAIARLLMRHGRPDDLVYSTFGQAPIMFTTGRRCAGLLKESARSRPGWNKLPDYLFNRDAARWLVIRPAWQPLEGYGPIVERWRERARSTGARLIAHPLKVADIGWGNRPEIRYHYFTSPGSVPSRDIVVLEIRSPEHEDAAGASSRQSTHPH